MHLVGFIIRIYHDARLDERHILSINYNLCHKFVSNYVFIYFINLLGPELFF